MRTLGKRDSQIQFRRNTADFFFSLTFLRAAKESPILLQAEVDLNQVRSCEELHDHSGRDDGRNAQLHESPPIRGENDTHPVERVRGF